jgi:uncharacterized protein (DUF305 family)
MLMTLALAACSSGAEAPKALDPAAVSYLKENDKAMSAMMSRMAVKPTGDVDKDFALMMIPHHQGAIDMSKALLKYGKNEELKQLARNIIANQAEEIALMRRVIGETPATPAKATMEHDHSM